MTRTTPTIHNTTLLIHTKEQTISIIVESPEWFAWLHQDSSTIFSFHTHDGMYTARKERAGNQRGSWYWKAYRTHHGKLYRAYIGKSSDLTLAKLNEIAQTLSSRIHKQTKHTPHPTPAHTTIPHPHQPDNRLLPILASKLHPPRLGTGLINRTRLLAQLNACLAYKLTLLIAPAGFGKSTLINQWLATQNPYASLASWVSLDTSDNDPFRFWRIIMTACLKLIDIPERPTGEAALALLNSLSSTPFDSSPLEIALTRLLNTLTASSTQGTLILDDYHTIHTPFIHETLTFFIDHLPTHIQVVLLSRSQPPLPLLRWQAKGEIAELHTSDLRFTLAETEAYLHQSLPISLSTPALHNLNNSLEGWATGLRLLALNLSTWHTHTTIEQALLQFGKHITLSHQTFANTSDPQISLLTYFVTEILDTQTTEMQHFLLSTSLLTRLNAPLCTVITGDIKSSERLDIVAHSGLFLEALAGPGGWYRYHALFAEAMRREASHRLGKDAIHSLLTKACSWYEQADFLLEALDTAWLAQDLKRTAQLIEQIYEQSFNTPQSMLQWLERIPADVLQSHPRLCFFFATELRFPIKLWFAQEPEITSQINSLSSATHIQIEALLSMAEEGWHNSKESAWIGGIWAHRALSALLDPETSASTIHFAQQALVFLADQDTLDRRLQMYRSLCLYVIGREKLSNGQTQDAEQLLLQAKDDNVPPGNLFLTVDIDLLLGKTYLRQNKHNLAQQYLQQALANATTVADDKVITDAQFELNKLATNQTSLLSSQEERILHLLIQGYSNQAIAHKLIISVNTVKYHIKHLYQKLNVNNRLQASEAARRLHIFSPPTH